MSELTNDWWHGFQGSFETDEEVIEFICNRINTSDFEDSYINVGGHSGEPNEQMKYTAEEKRETVYDYLSYLVKRKDKLEKVLKGFENTRLTPEEAFNLSDINGRLVRDNDRQRIEIKQLKTELERYVNIKSNHIL